MTAPSSEAERQRRRTSQLLVVGVAMVTLSMFGQAALTDSDRARVVFVAVGLASIWIGVVLMAQHHRWVTSQRDRDRHGGPDPSH